MKKDKIVLLVLAVIVVGVIFGINYAKGNGNQDDGVMKCIAEKSVVLMSPTCSACAYQKQIFGDYLDFFDIRLINENKDLVNKYGVTRIPAWIIDEKLYQGVQSIEDLKKLTRC
ncbi:MAG: hypothetical protein ABIH37_00670 [archaeon]